MLILLKTSERLTALVCRSTVMRINALRRLPATDRQASVRLDATVYAQSPTGRSTGGERCHRPPRQPRRRRPS